MAPCCLIWEQTSSGYGAPPPPTPAVRPRGTSTGYGHSRDYTSQPRSRY